jgi:hypothetical protein
MLAQPSIAIKLGDISGSKGGDMVDHSSTLSWLKYPVFGRTERKEQLVESRAGAYGNAKHPIMQYATVRTHFMNL